MENSNLEALVPTVIIGPGKFNIMEPNPFNVKGNDIEIFPGNTNVIPVKVTSENPGMTIEGENITITNAIFDIDFLDIPADSKNKYVGILSKAKNLKIRNCTLVMRYNSIPGQIPYDEFPRFFPDMKYMLGKDEISETTIPFIGFRAAVLPETSAGINIHCLMDFRQTLPDGNIVRRVMGTDKTCYQLYVNDMPVPMPSYGTVNNNEI